MSKLLKKVLAAVGVLAILVGLAASMATKTEAANLTAGNYTYVINGEEFTFPYDPVIRKDGLLLPLEVFQQLGIQVDGTLGKDITISKDGAPTEKLTVGTTASTTDGAADSVATAPLRLSGRVFLPADVLKDYGIDVTQDANFIIMRDYTAGVQAATNYSSSDWTTQHQAYAFNASPKSDSNIYLSGEFTYLTPNQINSTNLGLTYGMRARLLSLAQSNTLIMVKLTNSTSVKSGALQSTGLYLVDGQGNQYDLASVLDVGNGLLTNKIAPGVTRVGVLVFPPVANKGTTLSLWYDANNGSLGTWSKLQ